MADEPVDPRPALEEACKPKCTSYMKEYEACVERVRSKGEGHCTGQSFDYLHCLDKCIAPQIFKKIK